MEHLNAVRDTLTTAWRDHCEGSTFLTAAGAAAVTFWTTFMLFTLALVLPGVDLKKHGKWAVVTGATDGIG